MCSFLAKDGVTILDRTMNRNEIRIIKSHSEILGFNIENKTGQHLYVEPIFDICGNLIRLEIHVEPNL